LIIQGIVKILHLSLQIVDRLLLIGVAEGELLVVLLEVRFLLFQVEAFLLEVPVGVVQLIDLPFVLTFHLFGLPLEFFVGIVDLLDFEEGLFILELGVVTGHRGSFLAHLSVIISISIQLLNSYQ